MKISKKLKVFSVVVLLSLVNEILFPTVAWALTSGPSQPETDTFTPVNATDMVNLFTGDYSYNIPLLDVEGYPVNLAYNSGITMEQEASWVGLGWNINPGSINRNVRGLPDEFNGDLVKKTFNIKPNRTFGVGFSKQLLYEIAGKDLKKLNNTAAFTGNGLNLNLGGTLIYNNYFGYSFSFDGSANVSHFKSGKSRYGAGLSVSSDPDGMDISPDISMWKIAYNATYNTRNGLMQVGLGQSSDHNFSKNFKQRIGYNASISFSETTYNPDLEFPMENSSLNVTFRSPGIKGGPLSTFFANGMLNLAYSEQKLKFSNNNYKAYGYDYVQNANVEEQNFLMDISRENNGVISKNTPNLPVLSFNNDQYSINGQGISGSVRGYRNDIPLLSDPGVTSYAASHSISPEYSSGNGDLVGADYDNTDIKTSTNQWNVGNNAQSAFSLYKPVSGEVYEPVSYITEGETSFDESMNFNSLPSSYALGTNGFNVFTNNLAGTGKEPTLESQLGSVSNKRAVTERRKRTQVVNFLKREQQEAAIEASKYEDASRPKDHTAEISVLKADGSRYVFGLPVYNTLKKEVSFAIGGNEYLDPADGLVTYEAGVDNSIKNSKGRDNFYHCLETPAYAQNYLITSVLSPDFVDIDQDGPDLNDIGTYTLFTYEGFTDYKWRMPYLDSKANLAKGVNSLHSDDKASYIYGEKKQTYLTKIETKNYIAIFDLGIRRDNVQVEDENGGRGTANSKYLKKITLYSRADYEKNTTNATPIKTVHFVYDYSLCKGVPNNDGGAVTTDGNSVTSNEGGKLTLRKVYFTYGKNNKAALSPYVFNYTTPNPSYKTGVADKWGNFQDNSLHSTMPHNSDYPYVYQNKDEADENSTSWSLNEIELPSGGKITLELESDDYAYVQDKEAMGMFKVVDIKSGVISNWNENWSLPSNRIQFFPIVGEFHYLVVESEDFQGMSLDYLKSTVLKGLINSDMYFRFKISNFEDRFDWVSGYVNVIDAGKVSGNSDNYIWLKVQTINRFRKEKSLGDVNPIRMAAINYARINTPKESFAFSGEKPLQDNVSFKENALNLFGIIPGAPLNLINNLIVGLANPVNYLLGKQIGNRFDSQNSYVKLNMPKKTKYGGGLRVKRVEVNDNWNVNGTNSNGKYGQIYTYTQPDVSSVSQISSTGVVSYEPLIGGEESPFKKPIVYQTELKWVPDINYMQEEPFGEMFYPSAVVGYSKVTVESINNSSSVIPSTSKTGVTIHEFYTAKDYPVLPSRTELANNRKYYNPKGNLKNLFKIQAKNNLAVSQGYQIIVNDMHGKPKSVTTLSQSGALVSKLEYEYNYGNRKMVETNFTRISPNGSISQGNLGVTIDAYGDQRYAETKMNRIGLLVNLEFAITKTFEAMPIWPVIQSSETILRSSSFTKVISCYGVLTQTKVTTPGGAVITTDNLAFDSETGAVLLSRVSNAYGDQNYSFNYPAHWYYTSMGGAYKNIGATLPFTTDAQGQISASYNHEGDEVLINDTKYWVIKRTNGYLALVNQYGVPLASTSGTMVITRSGYKNLVGLSMGAMVTQQNPLYLLGGNSMHTKVPLYNGDFKVLAASAIEYKDNWKTFCDCYQNPEAYNTYSNPYLRGVLGNWRPFRNYTYLTDRNQTHTDVFAVNPNNSGQTFTTQNSNIRKDGFFTSYNPFWVGNAAGTGWNISSSATGANPDWTYVSEVTQYIPNGFEIENRDALNRYSSATYGYRKSVATSVAANAKYSQIGFDGFEDYDLDNCASDHFGFKKVSYRPNAQPQPVDNRSTQKSHSGKYSISVKGSNKIILSKDLLNNCN